MRRSGQQETMRKIGIPFPPLNPEVLALVEQHGKAPEALPPIFRVLQARYSGLTDQVLTDAARALGISIAHAQGVASFYALLSTSIRPPHTPRICDSPPCWLHGVAQVRAAVEQALGAAWGVERTRCLGLCARAPAALNEENYLMQKFTRQVLGTHNVDHCARLCHASTVAGLRMSLGSGAMSNTMHDIVEQAQALFITGSNTTEQHTVFGTMIRQAVLNRGVKLVVADPRAIDIVEFATLHLRQRPGTDVALLNGLMHIILQREWHDQAFIKARTEGFDDLRGTVDRYPPALVSEITGVAIADLQRAAELLAVRKPMAVIWAMGITQHTTGVLNVLSLVNLQLLLGNLGVAGGGVNPLRGQNNVQGSCDMGHCPISFQVINWSPTRRRGCSSPGPGRFRRPTAGQRRPRCSAIRLAGPSSSSSTRPGRGRCGPCTSWARTL